MNQLGRNWREERIGTPAELHVGERVLCAGETDIYVVIRVDRKAGSADLLHLRSRGFNRIEENVPIEDLVRLSEFGRSSIETESESEQTSAA